MDSNNQNLEIAKENRFGSTSLSIVFFSPPYASWYLGSSLRHTEMVEM